MSVNELNEYHVKKTLDKLGVATAQKIAKNAFPCLKPEYARSRTYSVLHKWRREGIVKRITHDSGRPTWSF